MRLNISFLFFVIVFSLNANASFEVNKSINEDVAENLSFQVILTDTETVSLSFDVISENTDSLNDSLAQVAFARGIKLSKPKKILFNRFVFTLQESQLFDLLTSIESNLSANVSSLKYLNLRIIGNITEQKVIGELYRFYKKIKTDQSGMNVPANFEQDLGSYRKEQTEYFSKFLAGLLICNSRKIQDVDFLIKDEKLFCVTNNVAGTLNQGQIANIVLNYKNFLTGVSRNPERYVAWLGNIINEDNIDFTDALSAYLSDISIETINKYYQEYLQLSSNTIDSFGEGKPKLNSSRALSNINSTSISSAPLGTAIVLNDYINICSFFDCDLLKESLEIEFFDTHPAIIKVDYAESSAKASNTLIANNIIRPLLMAGYSSENITLYKLGWEDEYNDSLQLDLMRFNEVSESSNLFNMFSGSNKCFESQSLDSREWAIEKILSYGIIYKLQTQSSDNIFSLFQNNCISSNSEFEVPTLIANYQQQLKAQDFSVLKSALLSRLVIVKETDIYDIFSEIYQYPIIEYQTKIIREIQLDEVKGYNSILNK